MTEKAEKSWQSRIDEATDAIAQKFVESISYDRRLFSRNHTAAIRCAII